MLSQEPADPPAPPPADVIVENKEPVPLIQPPDPDGSALPAPPAPTVIANDFLL